jgi:hypothetical protein
MIFKTGEKTLNYEYDPCTEPIEFLNDTKINQVQENKKTTKFIISNASKNGVDTTPNI